MSSSYKLMSHFTKVSQINQADSPGKFSHTTLKTKKTIPKLLRGVPDTNLPLKYRNIWFVKRTESDIIAKYELVAQELFRLLIPGHPKTRIVVDENRKLFIASKEIPQSEKMPLDCDNTPEEKSRWNTALKNGTISGLGEIAIISVLVNEVDLKNGNIRIDQQGRLIKFDGDWCFAHLRNNWLPTPIKPTTIANSPYPSGYNPFNWLGIINQGSVTIDPLLDRDLSCAASYRADANHALMKACILPDELIRRFIASYVTDPGDADIIYREFIERREQMYNAAIADKSFLSYLESNTAEVQLRAYIEYLKTFKTMGKNLLFQSISDPENQIFSRFNQLCSPKLEACRTS